MGKDALSVALFMHECMTRHSAARIHISDQGREFVNQVCESYYQLSGTKQHITSAYHPQANGEVERFNRTTQECFLKTQEIHCRIGQEDTQWAQRLNSILFAYRVRKQASTKLSPFQIMYNRDPVLPHEMEDDLEELRLPVAERPLEDVIDQMVHIHETINKIASENIKKAAKHYSKGYNNRHARNIFEEGDKVWRKNPLNSTKLKSLKKGAKWIGPYTVYERNEAGNYKLQDKNGKINKKAYPPSHLKRYIQRPPNVPSQSDDEYASASDEEEAENSGPGTEGYVSSGADTVLYANT